MGKKGGKNKGKAVVMTQQEFFNQTSSATSTVNKTTEKREENKDNGWGQTTLFESKCSPQCNLSLAKKLGKVVSNKNPPK